MHEIAFVILSCDKYKITWKPCVDYLFRTWPDCPYNIYLLNNIQPSNDNRITDLLVGDDVSWSDSLIRGLEKISEKRVFFIYDDSFFTYMNTSVIERLFRTAVDRDLVSMTLRRNPFDKGTHYTDGIVRLHSDTRYRNALFLNLMKRDILLSLLAPGENAWQFEKEGNVRNRIYDFYAVGGRTTIAKYEHGIIKGKWLPNVKSKLIEAGYVADDQLIGTFTRSEVIKMNLYAVMFLQINKFYHFFRLNKFTR